MTPEKGNSDEGVLELVEECLVALERGDGLAALSLKERAGPRWDDVLRCVNIAYDLSAAAELLSDDSPDSPLPARIGRFEVVRLLGEGGFSRVFLALDESLKRSVALKVIPRVPGDEASDRRIRAEGHALAQVDHGAVLRVHEIFETADSGVVVTEFVPGPTLDAALRAMRDPDALGIAAEPRRAASALMAIEARLEVSVKLADALAECHRRGVIHRDLKPANVLLPEPDSPKLIDFGISHAGGEGSGVTEALVGTLPYLAPEQLTAGRTGASERSEVYSLAVLIYELLTLEHPWGGEAPEYDQPAPLMDALPGGVGDTLERALQPRASDRYASVSDFASDLRNASRGGAVEGKLPAGTRALRSLARSLRKFPGAWAAAFVALAALTALGVGIAGVAADRSLRRDLAESISSLAEDAGSVDSPVDAVRVFDDLDDWENEAMELNEGGLAAGWTSPFVGESARVRGLLRSAMESAIALQTQRLIEDPLEIDRQRKIEELSRAWSGAIVRSGDVERLAVCRLQVPAGLVAFRLGHGEEPECTPIEDLDAVPEGRYRLVNPANGIESEFVVYTSQLASRPRLREAATDLLTKMSPLYELDDGEGREPVHFLREDLPTSYLALAFGKKSGEAILNSVRQICARELSATEAAIRGLSFEQANLLAAHLGYRLPTLAELKRAAELELLDEGSADSGSVYYWSTLTTTGSDHRFSVRASRDQETGRLVVSIAKAGHPRHAPVTAARVRLVSTASR